MNVTEASGTLTHPLIASMIVRPVLVTNGTSSTANMATLYLEDAPSGVTPTGGTYTLWSKAGANKFGGNIINDVLAGTGNRTVRANSVGALFASVDTLNKAITIESPTSTENLGLWKTPVAITIQSVDAVLVGSSTPSVTYQLNFASDRSSGSPTTVYTAGQTVTSTTTGNSASGVNDNTIPAGSWIWITTSAQSGTVTSMNVTINYTKD